MKHSDTVIDLRSDTKTRPPQAMRAAMARAQVGDEQAGEDPTCNRLQQHVAEMLGMDDALFVVSGTMCNNIAIASFTQRGDAIVVDRRAHILRSETGGAAVGSSVVIDQVDGDRGHFTCEQLRDVLDPGSLYTPRTALVCLEQTHNLAGGTVWDYDRWTQVCATAHDAGAAVLVDGARLWNAVVASGMSASTWAQHADAVWVDFTKGLGAPIGAVLAGGRGFCVRARRNKHLFGAALRQAGIAAAGCLYALTHHVDRLADDHVNAARLADALEVLDCAVERPVDTTMVFFTPPDGIDATRFVDRLAGQAVLAGRALGRVRLVTHLDISAADIDNAIAAIAATLRHD
jgi:threonine aldolase